MVPSWNLLALLGYIASQVKNCLVPSFGTIGEMQKVAISGFIACLSVIGVLICRQWQQGKNLCCLILHEVTWIGILQQVDTIGSDHPVHRCTAAEEPMWQVPNW